MPRRSYYITFSFQFSVLFSLFKTSTKILLYIYKASLVNCGLIALPVFTVQYVCYRNQLLSSKKNLTFALLGCCLEHWCTVKEELQLNS